LAGELAGDIARGETHPPGQWADRIHPVGVLYVDVYPYRMRDVDTDGGAATTATRPA
jgi:hypothetical protein